jgi:hypothetical protein
LKKKTGHAFLGTCEKRAGCRNGERSRETAAHLTKSQVAPMFVV